MGAMELLFLAATTRTIMSTDLGCGTQLKKKFLKIFNQIQIFLFQKFGQMDELPPSQEYKAGGLKA